MAPERLTTAAGRAAAEHEVVRAARASYGRLVAVLAASSGDIELAEDALATALERALATWPADGVPANPEGWLIAVARNRQRDHWRSAAHRTAVPLAAIAEGVTPDAPVDPVADLDPDAIPDRRLQLLFACAHPAIDPGMRTPLMLQVVLGVDADQIAAAFAVSPAAMAKRLVRAKRRIRDARIPFTIPDRSAMVERLPPVLEAIYGCAAVARPDRGAADAARVGSLAAEARHLSVTLAKLLGDQPEAWGLAALIAFVHARATGRPGRFVPLDAQDTDRWDAALIAEGEAHLRRADGSGALGRFQLEAAIQAVHCDRARTGRTDWRALHTLYSALVTIAPSLGSRVALAAVTGWAEGPEAGLAQLDELAAAAGTSDASGPAIGDLERFQPYHATRADLLVRAGRHAEAVRAFDAAIALTRDDAVTGWLDRRRQQLGHPAGDGCGDRACDARHPPSG